MIPRNFLHFFWAVGLAAFFLAAGSPAGAQESASQPVPEVPAVAYRLGQFKIDGSGDASSDSQELNIRAQVRDLFCSPGFLSAEGRVAQEKFRHYDLHRWGAEMGAGWALDPKTDLTASYRREAVSVFNISPDADPAYRSVSGLNGIAALGLAFSHDQRDDPYAPTRGHRAKLRGELALHVLGSDSNFGRIDSDWAYYTTPWKELTLVEHVRLGWMENFGRTEEVPFFERYFVGGSNTVRGHRGRWLSPRGVDDQFIGGEIQMFNNLEARWPLFKERFRRRLSTAAFFDIGRSFRRFSEVGEFGCGAGAGLRYVVDWWQLQGVLRADLGVNLNPENDDSVTHLHITFGMPF